MESSKIPIRKWYLAIYNMVTFERGISSLTMAEILGIKQQSAWYLMHRIRESMRNDGEIVLRDIVQIDEFYDKPNPQRDSRLLVLKKRHSKEQDEIHGISDFKRRRLFGLTKKGRKTDKAEKQAYQQKKKLKEETGGRKEFGKNASAVLGMVDSQKQLVLVRLGDTSNDVTLETIYPLLTKYIDKNSIVVTDKLPVYKRAKDLFLDHIRVKHGYTFVDKNGFHTNAIENVWSHLQRMKDSYIHISQWHYQSYLDEYTFRYNMRKLGTSQYMIDNGIFNCMGNRLSYKMLINRNPKKKLAA